MAATNATSVKRTGVRLVSEKLGHPFLAVSFLIMAAVTVTIYTVMESAQRRLIEHEAIKIAEVVARQALASRTVYTSEIADKLRLDGFGPHPSAHEHPGFVHLPAQFLKLVGRESSNSSDGLYRYRPLSKWNLEPTQGLNDEFQRWAWAELEKQDQESPALAIAWKAVWRFETVSGIPTLRYMRADAASTPACVNCHNIYEKLPETQLLRTQAGVSVGKQWKQHQLLGAIEVQVPVDRVEALAEGQTRSTLFLVMGIAVLGMSLAGWCAVRDVRHKQQLAMQFERQAKFDSLTDLPNRALFGELAAASLKHAQREKTQAGILFLDLDNFKTINDSLGHAAGDEVLRETGRRISAVLRDTDMVSRYSGDEFVLMVTSVRSSNDLALVGRKVIDELVKPLHFGEQVVFVSASIGISCYPQDGDDIATLLKNADAAMYKAKEHGRNNYQFFSAAMNLRAVQKLSMMAQLRQAVEAQQFELVYQPKFSISRNEITGVEALIRWRHPEKGLLTPIHFVPLAEETGLIEPIGEWCLMTALRQAKQWQEEGLRFGRIAVNLSMRQFRNVDLASGIFRTLDSINIPGHRLELEITESMVVKDPDAARKSLTRLHDRGISIAIDDFGMGYSSLAYLKTFPINALKIDKSFIDGLPADENDCAITRAIIAMADGLRIKVVAEGVETQAQLDFLAQEGCDEVQGYFLSHPLSPDALTEWMRKRLT